MPAASRAGAKPPLVVLAHGGPWARDVWGFDPEVQFLANRGDAIWQPTDRGSSGFAFDISEAPKFAFAEMSDDVTDAVKQIAASGLIAPQRIGICGASFSGFLALSGAVNEPDLYRCAASIAGVFDWSELIAERTDNPSTFLGNLFLRLKYGHPTFDREKFVAVSPLLRADRIRIPVFLSHGRNDQRVSADQSVKMLKTLKNRDAPVTSFFPDLEGHSFQSPRNRARLIDELEQFFKKDL